MTNVQTFSGESPWQIAVRDKSLVEKESCAGYSWFRASLLHNNVGEFTISIPSTHPAAPHFLSGAGIIVRPQGVDEPIFSGRMMIVTTAKGGDQKRNVVTAQGLTDEILMARDLAFVDPDTDVSSSGLTMFPTTHDVRTGVSETVMKQYLAENIGPTAGIARRQHSYLSIPVTTGLGTSRTWKARFDNLLGLLQKIAAHGNLSFRLVQTANGTLEFQVWERVVRAGAIFSIEGHNLDAATLIDRMPDVDGIIVGGGGEGKARVFTRRETSGSAALYGMPSWRFHDQTSTVDLNELRDSADEDLLEGKGTAGITLYPIEVPHLRYGTHYQLGDVVQASLGGTVIEDVVSRVVIEHSEGEDPSVQPTVGPTNPGESSSMVTWIRRLMRNLNSIVRV